MAALDLHQTPPKAAGDAAGVVAEVITVHNHITSDVDLTWRFSRSSGLAARMSRPPRGAPRPLVLRPTAAKPIDRRDDYRMVTRIARIAGFPRGLSPLVCICRDRRRRTTERDDRACDSLADTQSTFLAAHVTGV